MSEALTGEPAPLPAERQGLSKPAAAILAVMAAIYALLHIVSLNLYPIETWTFRALHVTGGLALVFLLMQPRNRTATLPVAHWLHMLAFCAALFATALVAAVDVFALTLPVSLADLRGPLLLLATIAAVFAGWIGERRLGVVHGDVGCALVAAGISFYAAAHVEALQVRMGVFPMWSDVYVATTAAVLILEATRRATGMALVAIAGVFISYALFGSELPGVLEHSGYKFGRLSTYLLTDNGVLGITVSVSSTYLVLFIVLAAFLQVTGVGDYFVRLSFALAGGLRGGPAKVAVLASGLMGMINGSSAGNVVATGSFTIPLMNKVGYPRRTSGAIEAAASTGGQIMPPIMGAGAFIMAEVTGIPYSEILVAAVLPAVFYFLSIYLMVDLEAAKKSMRGLPAEASDRPGKVLRQIYLLLPILVLIGALFAGYSVIRAGTYACLACAVLSFAGPQPLTLTTTFRGFRDATRMLLQLVVVCACAGLIVGVIGLTGVGLKFSALLLQASEHHLALAMVLAMLVTIVLGMGMPTTAAYAIAASVVAPGLVKLGVPLLTAHLFVFYYAVVSAITPPVALAGFAAAGIAGTDPLSTSVKSFFVGSAAFLVPIMFFFDPSLLMIGDWSEIIVGVVRGLLAVSLLASVIVGWFFGPLNPARRSILAGCVAALIVPVAVANLAGGLVVVVWAALRLTSRRRRREADQPNAQDTGVNPAYVD
ncbi:TRAP transporter permease [Marinibacterium sp. SX1]|uniref:TRAP transporter permease n=1 Tax=Marinibacterium sp. SX1 TaxID=3388424 RepID=UPI003D181308